MAKKTTNAIMGKLIVLCLKFICLKAPKSPLTTIIDKNGINVSKG